MKVIKVVSTVVYALLIWLTYQLLLPVLSPGYFSGIFFIGFWLTIGTILVVFYTFGEDDDIEDHPFILVAPCVIGAIWVVGIIIGGIAGSDICNATKLYNQLGEVEEKSFTEEILPIDNSQIPIVDQALARKVGEKELGKNSNLGSQTELGTFTIQNVNGELVWVAPLEHSGFFKWMNNRKTPGYIKVSASNPSDVELVEEINGEKLKLVYLENAYFSEDVIRHVRNNGYVTQGLTENTFELDDEGRPYWVMTKYKNETIWRNKEAVGTIICDVQTGEITEYTIEETPEWVDIIQPYDAIENQIDNWGQYVHGYWNFSNEDKKKKTPEMLTVYNDNHCYYYTGLTSVGSDDATIGFIMVDTRTKKAVLFVMNGAIEDAAMRSAEGMVQDMEYKATEPLPLNVNGVPTYFMPLKDKEGLIKSYAMVNIKNYEKVAIGKSISEVKRQYMNKMATSSNNEALSQEAYQYTVEGVITRISPSIQDGNTYYYIILDDDNTKLFIAPYSISEELPITREGDKVRISYMNDSNMSIDIAEFDNMEFSQLKSEEQQKLEERNEEVKEEAAKDSKVYKVDSDKANDYWNNLSEEEKAKIMKELEDTTE